MTINKSKSADTRSADHLITKDELLESSVQHIGDVKQGMMFIAQNILEAANKHDWTKMVYIDKFHKQFEAAQKSGEWGKGWYDEIHNVRERHHFDNAPEDVNLVDVIEQIVDCVMAGMARSGKYREEEPNAELLVKAYKNTVKMLCNEVRVNG